MTVPLFTEGVINSIIPRGSNEDVLRMRCQLHMRSRHWSGMSYFSLTIQVSDVVIIVKAGKKNHITHQQNKNS